MLKVGDKVVCVDDSGLNKLIVGNKYKVTSTRKKFDCDDGYSEENAVQINHVNCWFREERFKLYEGEENMELKDIIKVGYLVETKGCGYYLALQNKEDIVMVNGTDFNYIKNNYYYEKNEIIKIYGLPRHYGNGLLSTRTRELIWERSEEVEMTIAEIEDKLGIKGLKIVKE